MRRILIVAVLALMGGSVVQPGTAQITNQYAISFHEQDKRLAKIEARIALEGNTLQMNPEGAGHLPDGWSTFVRSLAASDESGDTIPIQYMGKSRWKVPDPLPKFITLSYEILIHHDQGRWPFGHDEAAYAKRDCVFCTGSALFIGTPELKDINVQFNIPSGWKVSTAWTNIPDQTDAFAVSDAEELTNTCMLIGKHSDRRIKQGGLEMILAVGEDLKNSEDYFESIIRQVISTSAELFEGSPTGKFVAIINRDHFDGGGGFHRGISILFKDAPNPENAKEVVHVITHEILHLWNGLGFRPANQVEVEWFVEGFTDYISDLVEARTGLINEQELFARFAKKYDEYLEVAGKLSMVRAGEDKSKNYNLLYSGGLITALALDIELRRNTKSDKGLDEFMKRIYREFGSGNPKYNMGDIVRIANETAGTDVTIFFRDFVEGTKIIPLESYLSDLGLRVGQSTTDGKQHTIIERKPDIKPSERSLLSKLIGNPR